MIPHVSWHSGDVTIAPASDQITCLALAYFLPETDGAGEQVYFAVSSPGNPLVFEPVGDGPALTSSIGEGGVRDPFLVRDELSGGFRLLATNLRVFPDHDWDRARWRGSREIVVWSSPDLETWSEPALVPLAPEAAGCTWAPESVLDGDSYLVVFSSSPAREGWFPQTMHDGDHLRVLAARTTDFASFSQPFVLIDPGHPVIDTNFLVAGAGEDRTVYRFTKDESDRTDANPEAKHVFVDVGPAVSGPMTRLVNAVAADHVEQSEGPVAFEFGGRHYLLLDEFGMRGYVAFSTDDLASGTWEPEDAVVIPAHARHGSVLAITTAEREALLSGAGTR